MAGKPKRAAMLAELERMTREEFGPDGDETALDFAELWVASGKTILALAAELSRRTGHEIFREALSKHLTALQAERGAEGDGTLTRARARGAHSLAEQALQIASSVDNKDDAPGAALHVKTLQWTAERYAPGEFAVQKAPSVVVNLGALYLDALRQPAPPRPVTASVTVEDAEVLSIEPASSYPLANQSTSPLLLGA